MKILLTVLSTLLAASRACSPQDDAGESAHREAFRKEVSAYAHLLKLPGLSVAVVSEGRIVYRQNEGYADVERQIPVHDDSIFPIASITKTFTAVMLLQYAQEGKLSLDDYLLKYPLNTGWHSPHRINPNIRLKHVLSMTSGGVPGTTYSYHGGRYNFLSGVFDQVSGRESPDSYVQEIKSRILDPLHLTGTRAGYPDKPDALTPRIVKRYQVALGKNGAVYTEAPYTWNSGYPASGLLSTMDDLATYTRALDDNRLISHTQYEQMTSPFVNSQGRSLPYGYGWVTQRFAGLRLHWAYGFGDSDSALFLRVPDKKLTLILFSNCAFPSQACRLGNGNVLRSPFALAFLKHFVFQKGATYPTIDYDGDMTAIRKTFTRPAGPRLPPLLYEELYTQALLRAFLRETFHTRSQQPEQLTRLLYDVKPEAFTNSDPTLIYLLSQLEGANLRQAAARWIRAYHPASDFRPDIPYCIGKYYERQGDSERAMQSYRALVDTPGFEDEDATIEACLILGKYYFKHGNTAQGRAYLWKAALYGREAQYSNSFFTERLKDLNRPPQAWLAASQSQK